jgi:hypothetical protein
MNKLIIKNLLAALLILIHAELKAQALIYKTYEDFRAGKPEVIDNIKKAWWQADSFGKQVVFEIEGEKKQKFKPKEFWGFTYKGKLFRSIYQDSQKDIACVADTGKIVLYFNGKASLQLLKEDANFGFMEPGSAECYISVNLNSEIIGVHWNFNGEKKYAPRKTKYFNKFKENNPEYQTLYDCIGETYYAHEAKNCIQKFNSSK